jgi:hypothetical protein
VRVDEQEDTDGEPWEPKQDDYQNESAIGPAPSNENL